MKYKYYIFAINNNNGLILADDRYCTKKKELDDGETVAQWFDLSPGYMGLPRVRCALIGGGVCRPVGRPTTGNCKPGTCTRTGRCIAKGTCR